MTSEFESREFQMGERPEQSRVRRHEASGGVIESLDGFVTVSWPTNVDAAWLLRAVLHAVPKEPSAEDVEVEVYWYAGETQRRTEYVGQQARDALSQCELDPTRISFLRVDLPTRYVCWTRLDGGAAELGMAVSSEADLRYFDEILGRSLPESFAGSAGELSSETKDALRQVAA